MTFHHDHFARMGADYAQARPTYPPELFHAITGLCGHHGLAVDIATGNGQAALALAPYFDQIIALDQSAAMLASAAPHPKIEYRQARAEQTGLPDQCADLVTVATALHWFDLSPFFTEAKRILKPNGVFAAWGYTDCTITPEIDTIVQNLYRQTLRAYWPANMDYIWSNFADPFPFEPIPMQEFIIQRE